MILNNIPRVHNQTLLEFYPKKIVLYSFKYKNDNENVWFHDLHCQDKIRKKKYTLGTFKFNHESGITFLFLLWGDIAGYKHVLHNLEKVMEQFDKGII